MSPAEVARHLRTTAIGRRIHHHEELGSTNDEASRLAREGAAHGETVLAEAQLMGRGRLGRTWASPARKNLYLSVVVRPDLPPDRVQELPLATAVAVAEALVGIGLPAGIKWPNDVQIDGKKIAGILGESSVDTKCLRYVILGIGVNLNATLDDLPGDVRPIATTVREVLGVPVDRASFAAALLNHLEVWLGRLETEGFAPVGQRWRERAVMLGHRIRVIEVNRVREGDAVDIDETGALLVRTEEGVDRILSGDVTSLRAFP